MRRAFSLIELSIVLVILGLLVGGILAGQSLIKASELRSISADLVKYQTAMTGFKAKYLGWPGDIRNATSFWGRDDTRCASDTGSTGTPGTCNGDGNGQIYDNASNSANERLRAWQQLALAGLVEGTYLGYVIAPSNSYVAGRNVPEAHYQGAAFGLDIKLPSGDQLPQLGNKLFFGGPINNVACLGCPWEGLFTAEEMWNLDKKMDDGVAWRGKFWTTPGYSHRAAGPASCTTVNFATWLASPTSAGYDYNLADTGKTCHGNYLVSGF